MSGEALIRNLLLARREMRRLGGRAQRVAYLPDSFGHVAQLPQIYRGLGLDSAAMWRAVGREHNSELVWKAPDGSSVLLHHLHKGYCYGGGAPKDAGAAQEWLRDKFTSAALRSTTRHVLILNGCDHTSFDPYLLGAIDAHRDGPYADQFHVRHSSLEEFSAAVAAELPPVAPPTPIPPPTPVPQHRRYICIFQQLFFFSFFFLFVSL